MSERDCLEMEEGRGTEPISISIHRFDHASDQLFRPICAIAILLGCLTMFAGVLVWGVLR